MGSVWQKDFKPGAFSRLEKNANTDVLIIGGGLAGLLLAHTLESEGIDCILCEASRIASGTTKNTTAKITSRHGLIYNKLIREFGERTAGLYLKANEEALESYRRLCGRIDCDFEEKDSYVYSLCDDEKIEKELTALKKLGCQDERADKLPLPVDIAGAVRAHGQAQFNPLKLVEGICGKLNIFEHTKVCALEGTSAVTERARINAKRIVVATHFPFINRHGSYFLKMYQHRSYVIALENAAFVDGMYLDESGKGLSLRNYKNLLLLGGGSHRTGKQGGGFAELRRFAARHYPNATEKFHWATQDCMTIDSVPYIGRYSAKTENLYVATGFNKWGMTGSMVAAGLLGDMLAGRENQYEKVFSPSRTMLRPSLASNAAEAVLNLITPTVPRCPHLGCALKWNEQEHTWDCPCHGSRFTEDGRLIDNPATVDLKLKKGGRV